MQSYFKNSLKKMNDNTKTALGNVKQKVAQSQVAQRIKTKMQNAPRFYRRQKQVNQDSPEEQLVERP